MLLMIFAVISKIPSLKQAFSTRKKLIDTLSRMEYGHTYEQYVSQIFVSKIFPFQHNYSLLSAEAFKNEEEEPLQVVDADLADAKSLCSISITEEDTFAALSLSLP
jgi:hypothetical protein